MAKIIVQNTEVNVVKINGDDYICLPDISKLSNLFMMIFA
mgnify:CR=1 FL=1|jgi:hypothetical protein